MLVVFTVFTNKVPGICGATEKHCTVSFDIGIEIGVEIEQNRKDEAKRLLSEEGRAGILRHGPNGFRGCPRIA